MTTNKEELITRPQTLNTPWYKRAVVPWMIILALALTSGGFIAGWTSRNVQAAQFEYEVAKRVSDSKTSQ